MSDKYNAYQLADMADTYSPDSPDSAGARFLVSVADAADDYDHDADNDWIHEAADGAVPIYTYERWQAFVDLGAFNEDISELGGAVGDLTQAAGIALYMIAERLLWAIAAQSDDSDSDES